MKKSKKGSKKKKPCSTSPQHRQQQYQWTDSINFVSSDCTEKPLQLEGNGILNNHVNINIVSWNILAEAYLNRKSHHGLPKMYQNVAFFSKKRRLLLSATIQKLMDLQLDVLCLQEMDIDTVRETLLMHAYADVSTPTVKGGGAGGRPDACCIYYNTNVWTLMQYQLIRLDDLATNGVPTTTAATSEEYYNNNLQGFQQSFLRRNMAILAKLQHKTTGLCIVIACAHLFWNPEYEYIKLCQAHYITTKAHSFAASNDGANHIPVILCGDFNSQPKSAVHTYLTHGVVNANYVAPWNKNYYTTTAMELEQEQDQEQSDSTVNQATKQLETLQFGNNNPRYLCDFTLNRLTRWLRILGIDCALETIEEEIQRTKEGNNILFQKSRAEHRTLVTTSCKMVLRKECPAGTYLVTPRSLEDLEHALVHMLLTHGVTLTPKDILSKCVVCNGTIVNVMDVDAKRTILASNNAPQHLIDDLLEVYKCDSCGQGYWWCDRPTSSASRVKNQATRLLELCIRGGVPIQGDLAMFDFLDIDKERLAKLDVQFDQLDCVDWLKDSELTNPLGTLESAYAINGDDDTSGGTCTFTNVTDSFVGVLDYVLFEPKHCKKTGHLYIPTSFDELNQKYNIRNGHVLPSDIWPSDHLAVGAQLSIFIGDDPPVESTTDSSTSTLCSPLGDEPSSNIQVSNISAVRQEEKVVSCSTTDAQHVNNTTSNENVPLCSPLVEVQVTANIPEDQFRGSEADTLHSDSATQDIICSPLGVAPSYSLAMHNAPTAHAPRCGCGCVPNILSLFEMAELRKQAKLKKANALQKGETN